MHIPRYITTAKLSILQKLCKKHNIKIKKKITKKDIIHKLNRFLLKSITKSELINLYENITKHNINKSNTKIQLINKLLYRTKSNNLTVSVNKISSYFYNKYQNNINKINYGAFGNTCEYALCKIFKLNITNHNGIETSYINILTKSLYNIKQEFKNTYNMKCIQYIGNTNHKVDFLCKSLNNDIKYTLSVKSNINSKHLVCPQILGQCSFNTFVKFIKEIKNIIIQDFIQLKDFISKNLLFLFNTYYTYLFSCDYLLWIKKNTDTGNSNDIINYKILTKKNLDYLVSANFTLSNSLNNWNSYNSLRYNNSTIGIFQLHNNRNIIKFRFYLDNLLKL
jgi:hypothetical protein